MAPTDPRPQVPDWVRDAVFYQIFPERYANGDPTNDPPGALPWGSAEPTRDNFFGGDLQGIIDHLDHIADLGATALYLTPIFRAQTNHRYDTTDYEAIDPCLGDLDTFRCMVREAHARGIRVVLDAVFNHCGIGHPAFADVVARGAESPYLNWFYVEDLPVRTEPQPNYATCGGAPYLPQWNVHNLDVRAHLFDVTRRWTAEGIDGWRLDVPYFMNFSFWRRFREVVKGFDSELYIVAEVWDVATDWVRGDIADGAMNYPLRDLILGLVADRSLNARAFADELTKLADALPAGAAPGMLNLLGSHDTERLLTRCQGDPARLRQALALLVTSPGVPMIYYGDEVGLVGDNDPGCRACMPWDESGWDAAVLRTTRELLRLRRDHPVLASGEDVVVHADDALFVRRRGTGPGAMLIAVNVAGAPRPVPLPPHHGGWADPATGRRYDGPATVPANGTLLLVAQTARVEDPCAAR